MSCGSPSVFETGSLTHRLARASIAVLPRLSSYGVTETGGGASNLALEESLAHARGMSSAASSTPPNPLSSNDPWTLVAPGYAEEAGNVMVPFARNALALLEPKPTWNLLDVAAGSGAFTLEAAPQVASVEALDFSPGMLAELHRRIGGSGATNIKVHAGDGQALPFADATFDAAASMFGLMFFPDRARGFAEMFRVLKPGGRAVVSSWAPVEQSPLMVLMFGALCAADPERPKPQANLLTLENKERFKDEMTAAGFVDVVIHERTHAIYLPGADRYWETIVRAAVPFVLLKMRLSTAEWERRSQVVLEYLRGQLHGPCYRETTAYLGIGKKPG